MKIIINAFVTARMYKNDPNPPIGFILDERFHIYYILKGKIALLWDIIYKFRDYSKVIEYSKQYCNKHEIDSFLFELKQKNLISINQTFFIQSNNFLKYIINEKDKNNYSFFIKKKRGIFYKNKYLETLSLQLNYACNLHCKHCYNPKNMNEYNINYNIAKNIIDEAYELGITNVSITGGECTINKDFLKIVQYIRQRNLALIFLTNGQRLYDDKSFFDKIVSLYPNQIKVSLYSMNSKIHDDITGIKNSHYKTLNVIKRLREKNIDIVINHTQLSLNKGSYADVKKFAAETGSKIMIGCAFINNKNNDNISSKLSKFEIEKYYYNSIKNGDELRPKFKKDKQFVCSQAGIFLLNVQPNLDITPCNDFNYILGNYKNNSLIDVWKNKIQKFQEEFIKNNLNECFKYDYCKYCSYCAKLAMYDAGYLKRSKTCCEDAQAYMNALRMLEKKEN